MRSPAEIIAAIEAELSPVADLSDLAFNELQQGFAAVAVEAPLRSIRSEVALGIGMWIVFESFRRHPTTPVITAPETTA